jgi:hypothetical protein
MAAVAERAWYHDEVCGFILCCLSLTSEFSSIAMITWYKCNLELKGSSTTTKSIPDVIKRQLILDQMAKDPIGMQGPHTVKEGIAYDTRENITWCTSEIPDPQPSN